MWQFIKPYLARTLAALIFASVGGILLKVGISQDQLYEILLGVLGIILGGSAVVSAHNAPPPKKNGG